MDLEVPYTVSNIETYRNSLRAKIVNMSLMISYTDSDIKTDRNSLRIKDEGEFLRARDGNRGTRITTS